MCQAISGPSPVLSVSLLQLHSSFQLVLYFVDDRKHAIIVNSPYVDLCHYLFPVTPQTLESPLYASSSIFFCGWEALNPLRKSTSYGWQILVTLTIVHMYKIYLHICKWTWWKFQMVCHPNHLISVKNHFRAKYWCLQYLDLAVYINSFNHWKESNWTLGGECFTVMYSSWCVCMCNTACGRCTAQSYQLSQNNRSRFINHEGNCQLS